jgi:hypothetical protein
MVNKGQAWEPMRIRDPAEAARNLLEYEQSERNMPYAKGENNVTMATTIPHNQHSYGMYEIQSIAHGYKLLLMPMVGSALIMSICYAVHISLPVEGLYSQLEVGLSEL